jgi:CBS domain-containing protein
MRLTIQDVMTRDVVTVRQHTSYKEIVRTLAEHRIAAVPVVDNLRRLLGIVTETDLVLKEAAEDTALSGPPPLRLLTEAKAAATVAGALMTSPVVTVGPDTTLPAAARRLHDYGVKRLPVVDRAGALVGIVTRGDLLKAFLRSDDELRVDVIDQIVVGLLGERASEVMVDVRDGVVMLTGRVETRRQALALGTLARAVDGVVAVENLTSWEPDSGAAAVGVR